jgi:uncharacterized protein (TIGR00730 family)
MNIAVFCSQYDVADTYMDAAAKLAKGLAENGHTLVWGGADSGIMGLIARTAKASGGRVIGVIRDNIKNTAYEEADEMHIVPDVAGMNAGLIERADAVVVLPGGIGTLHELTEFLRMRKNRLHAKETHVLDTDSFYAGFAAQWQRMGDERFIDPDVIGSVRFHAEPAVLVQALGSL